MFGQQSVCDVVGPVAEVCGNEVGHLAIFGAALGMIDDMQPGSVGREVVDINLLASEVSEESLRFLMAAATSPHQQQGALEMAPQLLDERKKIVPVRFCRLIEQYNPTRFCTGKRCLHRSRRDGHGDPGGEDWHVPPRHPGPSDSRLQQAAGFINEHGHAALPLGFF
jgi:hypothetical protein